MTSHTKTLLLYLAFFFIFATESRLLPEHSSMRQQYQEWTIRHEKKYSTLEETESRYRIFADNVRRIDAFNAANNETYTLGVNRYADLTDDEVKASRIMGYKPRGSRSSSSMLSFRYENVSVSDLPSYLDWRENGTVTPIKDQGPSCGSCWAFSAVAAVEGITKLKTGTLISLSEQELVDCDHIGKTDGCNVGWMNDAFQYIQKHGLSTEENYPYKGTENNCTLKQPPFHRETIAGYEDVPIDNETSLLKAVAHQPVSVAVDANSFEFRYYNGGVFTGGGCGTANLNHAVAVVGYGVTEVGVKYWILKNSWGKGWGEEGYMRFLRDVGQPEGLCGIATTASYPF